MFWKREYQREDSEAPKKITSNLTADQQLTSHEQASKSGT